MSQLKCIELLWIYGRQLYCHALIEIATTKRTHESCLVIVNCSCCRTNVWQGPANLAGKQLIQPASCRSLRADFAFPWKDITVHASKTDSLQYGSFNSGLPPNFQPGAGKDSSPPPHPSRTQAGPPLSPLNFSSCWGSKSRTCSGLAMSQQLEWGYRTATSSCWSPPC